MLGGGVGPDRDEAGDRDDVHEVRALAEPRLEGAERPDRAEVVDADDRLEDLRVAVEEGLPRRDSGVADEQVDARVALEHAGRDALDRGAVADVAGLVLVGVGRRATREPDHMPAVGPQLPAERRSDPRRGSRDDRDAHPQATVAEPRIESRRVVRGKAGARARRRQPPLDRLGDRPAARRGRRQPRVHLPGRAHRGQRARARGVGRQPARHELRRPRRRGRRPRLRRGVRHLRRRARPARPLGRVCRGRGPRGPLHGYAARPLLDGTRRQRLLARRVRPRRRAADGGRRRRLDRHSYIPRR